MGAAGYEITVTHTIDAAHRVVGHKAPDGSPGKCARLHGHTYRFDVILAGPNLDEIGFVVDFGTVKVMLDQFDHRTLLWKDDPLRFDEDPPSRIPTWAGAKNEPEWSADIEAEYGIVRLPFNPTAENLARYLSEGFALLTGIYSAQVVVCETAKTKAQWTTTA